MSKRVKNLITAELQDKFKGADSVIVIDYNGIDSKTTGEVRRALREKKVKMTVVRNAMASKALEAIGLKGAKELLTGTNAVIYGGESIVDAAKELVEQAKKIEKLKIKGAIVEGRLLDAKSASALAKLPSKKDLQAMIVGQILGPGRTLAAQVKAPGSKIAAQILNLVDKKKKEEEAPAAA